MLAEYKEPFAETSRWKNYELEDQVYMVPLTKDAYDMLMKLKADAMERSVDDTATVSVDLIFIRDSEIINNAVLIEKG